MDFLWVRNTSKGLGDFAPTLYCPVLTTTRIPQRAKRFLRTQEVQISKNNKFNTALKRYFD